MRYATKSILVLVWVATGIGLTVRIVPGQSSKLDKQSEENSEAIKTSPVHPQYWEYKGEELLLIGGSKEDNLFQIDSLTNHLDVLQSVGGNYVRNTMSSRDEGNLWPFLKLEDGTYDLSRWNQEYWQRFERFLQETSKRDIIVQIEIWATFDFYRDPWDENPFNPKNNINYSAGQTRLPEKITTHPTWRRNNFFWSVPRAENNTKVLWFQQQYVDKILSYTLNYDNVLYCMDNETSVTSEWGRFWSEYIQATAWENGKLVQTTEMWDPWDLSHVLHRETFDHPETYSFVDISQNNHNEGEVHWENGIRQIEYLKQIGALRPVTNVKIYGNDGGRHQTTRNAVESFVRNIFFGSSSARFHRPPSGQGLNHTAQMVIKSVRTLAKNMDFFNGAPDNELLSNRDVNEAYCRAIPGREYAVYFTDGGSVKLDVSEAGGASWTVRWLDISQAEWTKADTIRESNATIVLRSPAKGHWVALVQKKSKTK